MTTKTVEEMAVLIYNKGYHAGHHDTVEAQYTDIFTCDMATYHKEVVAEIVAEIRQRREEMEGGGNESVRS